MCVQLAVAGEQSGIVWALDGVHPWCERNAAVFFLTEMAAQVGCVLFQVTNGSFSLMFSLNPALLMCHRQNR